MLLSPQAERNWESLCEVLEDVLEDQSHKQLFALEIGSGTGQHVIRFAQKLPFVTWQPSDIKEEKLCTALCLFITEHHRPPKCNEGTYTVCVLLQCTNSSPCSNPS
uniref:Methyltransferase like 26 n=1 Tax=Fundulus heteroclitus TaxID=8078 RepID=A0A3Q2PJV9_FUNHE